MSRALHRHPLHLVALTGTGLMSLLSLGCSGGSASDPKPQTQPQPTLIHGTANVRWVGPGASRESVVDISKSQIIPIRRHS